MAGPYEVLYTTAVDIWSFGCFLLNILIGKCGPLRQRGVRSVIYDGIVLFLLLLLASVCVQYSLKFSNFLIEILLCRSKV